MTVVPVRNSGTAGSLVIVNFLADEHAELNRTLRTYALVALMSLGLISTIAGFQSGRLLAPLRTLEETARDITDDRPVPADPRAGQRRHHRPDPHHQPDARAAGRRVHRSTPLPRRRRARAQDPADRDARPPRAARPRRPRRGRARPATCCWTRLDRMSRLVGDLIVLAKTRRPDFLTPAPVDLGHAHARAARQGPGTRRPGLAARRQRRRHRHRRRAAHHPGGAAARRQRGQAHRPRRHHRHRLLDRPAARPPSGCATPVAVSRSRQREAIFERFGRGNVRPGDEGFGLGLSIVRAIAQAHGGTVSVTDAHPHGRPLRAHPADRGGHRHGPDPDRRGRGAHRVLRRQGPAGRGPPADRRRRRPRGASTRRSRVGST